MMMMMLYKVQILTFSDDLLLEIFMRVRDCRSVIRCGVVCKRWFSIISSIHHSLSLPFTIIFRHGRPDKQSIPLFEYFSNDSQILHGNYLDFLPPWEDLWLISSCDDLLLITRERGKYFMICNPSTRQWLELPQPPVDFVPFLGHGGLVCHPNRFKVILLWKTCYDHSVIFSLFYSITFCSETGEWTPVQTFTFDYDLNYNPPLVSNGILHWLRQDMEGLYVHGILALDPFKDENHPKIFRFIDFPSGLVQTSTQPYHMARVRLGLVHGRLRLSQLLVTKRKGFVLKVWELNDDDDDDDDDAISKRWTLVHDVTMKRWNDVRCFVVAFHPNNGNVLFLLHNKRYIYQYDIGEQKMEQICELPDVANNCFPAYLRNYVLVHPFWPTPIPALPSL